MKIEELRIGNLIQLSPEKDWYPGGDLTVVIESISNHGINYSNYPDCGIYWATLDNTFVGIPLTDEWFSNLGFDYHNENGSKWFCKFPSDPYNVVDISCENGEGYYLLYTDSEGYKHFQFEVIKYVHQLQNLYFALTGEELKIKYND